MRVAKYSTMSASAVAVVAAAVGLTTMAGMAAPASAFVVDVSSHIRWAAGTSTFLSIRESCSSRGHSVVFRAGRRRNSVGAGKSNGSGPLALAMREGRRSVAAKASTMAEQQVETTTAAAPPRYQPTRRRPLVDSKQVSVKEAQERWPDSNFDVPVDLPGAARTFVFGSPTPGLIVAGLLSVVALRMTLAVDVAPLGFADALAVPLVSVGWSFQEWAIHKHLLHGLENWMGHDVHEAHHDKPYYHVCVDPPDLVAGWTLVAACVFKLLLPFPLALTVLAAYMFMGLVYEWVHFIVHTRVVPRSQLGKNLKRHHTLHHLKDETCWLAFTAPPIDALFGTVPQPRDKDWASLPDTPPAATVAAVAPAATVAAAGAASTAAVKDESAASGGDNGRGQADPPSMW